jgi:hypothetical protein
MANDPSEMGPPQGNLFGRRQGRSAQAVKAPAGAGTAAESLPPATETSASVSTQAGAVDTRMPRPLVVGPKEVAAIQQLIKKAGEHRVPLEDMQRRALRLRRGDKLPKSYNMPFTIEIPFGFTVTYTVEEQPQGWTRHLSVAADRVGRAPTPEAVDMLMREFGFRAPGVRQIEIKWMEPLGNDRKAVNLVEYIEASDAEPGAGADYIPDPDAEPPEE